MQPIIPRSPISIRPATLDDLPAIDALQKRFKNALGFFRTAQFREYIERGDVLVARASGPCPQGPDMTGTAMLLGHIIWRDRYLKRDELGVIFQLCVAPGEHRKLIGASLVKAAFERSAYGCRLFCLWCAQDLEANHFWESLGFIPIAFRAGSRGRMKGGRVHIFWQRRICAGDDQTPWWFPSRTSGGAMMEDRIVLPIPPGTHWSDAMPLILPAEPMARALPGKTRRESKVATAQRPKPALGSPLWFAPPRPARQGKSPKAKRPKPKNDPKRVAAARELRDRWLERINSDGLVLSDARYDVGRPLAHAPPAPGVAMIPPRNRRLLPAA